MTTHISQDVLEVEAARAKLRNARGPQFWRGLEELADTSEFRSLIEREFPQGAAEMADPVSRRTFMKLMGASLALAGLTGCTNWTVYMPPEKIAPYTKAPEGLVPGRKTYYASTATFGGYGAGVLVESHEGRPTKIEGNPQHPGSLGATDLFTQASILTMYDPDRSTQVLEGGQPSSWDAAVAALNSALQAELTPQGAGLRLLTETVSSPTLVAQIQELLTAFPQARWVQYDPVNRDNVYAGAQQAFGVLVEPRYSFSRSTTAADGKKTTEILARVVVSLDADFLSPGAGFVPYARGFAKGRKVTDAARAMNRLYVVEANMTSTGAAADHRLPTQAGRVESVARALAQRLGVGDGPGSVTLTEAESRFVEAMAKDLEANRGASLVLAGYQQPPAVHALAHALNDELGNVGATVDYIEPPVAQAGGQTQGLGQLLQEIDAGQVQMLLLLGGNPAYNAPGDLRFAERVRAVPFKAHLSLFVDETSALSEWHIPAAHFLESWSDARAYDGTASIVQPLIEPLYGGKTAHDVLNVLNGQVTRSGYETVRAFWQSQELNGDFERAWQLALSRGFLTDTARQPTAVTLQASAVSAPGAGPGDGIEIIFTPDSTVWDGSYANNGWLQETPKTISQVVWENAVFMGTRTAIQVLGLSVADPNRLTPDELNQIALAGGRTVTVSYRGGSFTGPIWVQPGLPENTIVLTLGYGRTAAGRVGSGLGFNVYPIRTSDSLWFGSGAAVQSTGQRVLLVSTQLHWTTQERDIVRMGTLAEFQQDPKSITKREYEETYGGFIQQEDGKIKPNLGGQPYVNLYPEQPPANLIAPNQWAMVVNLNACIGCNACAVACQSENNIPIVGKDQVAVHREMNWIRIDRYFGGEDLNNPVVMQQPVMCMQCETAPCEVVCPVAATVHDNEGLNNMVYNRCVGTKYCSNNCPYKVRRFNFLQYSDTETNSYKLMRNPEVTVRNRGVMEKCTYCVQRIAKARQDAKVAAVNSGEAGRVYAIADGTIVTACEAACPTEAITFGDKADPNSRVAKLIKEPHNYSMLDFLNTKSRTTYLAKVTNHNPELEGQA